MAKSEQISTLEDIQTSIELARHRYRLADSARKEARQELVELFSSLVGQRISVGASTRRYLDTTYGHIESMPLAFIEYQEVEVVDVINDGVALRIGDEINCPIADIETIDFVPSEHADEVES